MPRLLILLLITLFCTSCGNQTDHVEEEQIIRGYNLYKEALVQESPTRATVFISHQMFDYYDSLIQYAIRLDSIKVAQLPVPKKMIVLMLRHQLGGRLLDMDGKSVYAFFHKTMPMMHGMIGDFEPGEASSIDDTVAQLKMTFRGQDADMFEEMIYEDGIWKVNVFKSFNVANPDIEAAYEKSEQSFSDYIAITLKKMTSKAPDSTLWIPLEELYSK